MGDDRTGDEISRPEDVARSYTLIDHEIHDDLWGLTTVCGGKLTTHRRIAERVADQVCAKFGIDRPCQTAEKQLPTGPLEEDGGLGGPPGPDPALCESMDVTRNAVRTVLREDDLVPPGDLPAVVQRTRAGMGACQGGRCAHRLAGELFPDVAETETTRAFESFSASRWAGVRHALWEEGLTSAVRTYVLHRGTMNRGGMPGPTADTIEYSAFDQGRASTGTRSVGGESDA